MMDLALHTKCSLNGIVSCSNSLCKSFIVGGMHETARRLLAIGLAMGDKDFTAIARRFGGSDQSATNWKSRGVPKAVIIKAATLWGVQPAWLAGEPGAKEPALVSGCGSGKPSRLRVAESVVGYAFSPDEQRLVDGFRLADDSLRRSMLLLAEDALSRFGSRRENHK